MTNQLAPALEPIVAFFKKHHPVIFISIICLLMAMAVYSLHQVFLLSQAGESNNSTTIPKFDQATIDKIKKLHNSGDTSTSTLVFPSPRANPFVE